MSRKITFKSIEELRKKDKEDALDAWVSQTSKTEPTSSADVEEPMKRISIAIPDSFHRKLKNHCVLEGISIKDKIINLIVAEMRL